MGKIAKIQTFKIHNLFTNFVRDIHYGYTRILGIKSGMLHARCRFIFRKRSYSKETKYFIKRKTKVTKTNNTSWRTGAS